jgi:hypothetical protein
LAESLHPTARDVFQYHFFNALQNVLDHIKKCFSIGEFISSQELLNMAEKVKSDGAKFGQYGRCRALFIALCSIKSNVTFAV